jgi:hypothetical protein
MPIDYADYEALTVAELKDMAAQLGVEIPHDARKSDIIDALRATSQKDEFQKVLEEVPPSVEQQNVYTRQMSSTETALVSNEDFWVLKLHS